MKVTGWTAFEDNKYKNTDEMTDEEFESATVAVIKEIRNKGYKFSGSAHQYNNNCCPIIDEKYLYCVSMRSWGAIMQKAYELPNDDGMGYVIWAWGNPNNEKSVYPQGE